MDDSAVQAQIGEFLAMFSLSNVERTKTKMVSSSSPSTATSSGKPTHSFVVVPSIDVTGSENISNPHTQKQHQQMELVLRAVLERYLSTTTAALPNDLVSVDEHMASDAVP